MTEVIQQEVKSFDLDEDQTKAIEMCTNLSKRIVAVTGSAGTGKTSIMKMVYDYLKSKGVPTALCAPTGKAAKRIKEATGIDAVTMHRLLEYPHPGEVDEKTGKPHRTTQPKRDRFYPFEYRVILADEYAMVNHEIHRNLIDALPSGGCIRMFGDANQLQPIESSKALNEKPSPFVESLDRFEGIRLKKIHRQAEASSIIANGRLITMGQMPRRSEDFQIKITEEPVEIVTGLVIDGLDDGVDYGKLDCQIITPTRVGWIGTDSLNAQIQLLLQPSDKPYIDLERHSWSKQEAPRLYQGDKVIFNVNNYALGIFNGETGIVLEADDLGVVKVDFGDKIIDIPCVMEIENRRGDMVMINPQKDIDLAYVITTHKSQGSEYDKVIYVINKSRPFLLNRKNLYTAISRARSHVTVVADQKALSLSLFKKGDNN